ncbi:bifunctional diguanylate cyclase/phosphodiesterase [Alkalihalophilus marmarensis]|uniref:putative bifunctional diguanylate cyclase/phosphodiesterase n=1 Tax=Alkalihalophilus marmarensis TaxID=521377 RepID=UPI002E238E2B|nr:bifunctional diguanylate cyclase/phosphodiesterase [Alkalihalophilus marmarensis]
MNESIGNKTIQLRNIIKTLEELHDIVFLMEYVEGRFKYAYFSHRALEYASLTEDCLGKYIDDVYPAYIAEHLQQMYLEAIHKRKPVTYKDKMNVDSMNQMGKSVITPIVEEDGFINYLLCFTEKLTHDDFFDSLTGLPSIKGLKEKLESKVKNAPDKQLAVCYLKINQFERIVDLIGHESMDEFTVEMTNRMLRVLQFEESGLARVAGDEYIFYVVSDKEICQVAAEIQRQLQAPYLIDEMNLSVQSVMGIAYKRNEELPIEHLINQSYHAMFQAKQKGGQAITVFNFNKHTNEVMNKPILERELRKAISRKELTLYFQPIVHVETSTVHFEALLRWFSPKLGTIPPDVFILVAEDRDFIQLIDEWVIEKACEFLRSLNDPKAKVAVNLSPKTLAAPSIESRLIEGISEYGISAEQIELEITEHSLLKNEQAIIHKLSRLKEVGFSVAIDDFGVSNASLNYLRLLPVDKIKIDKVFIHNIENETKEYHIVHSIISLARKLGLRVTAEGVETSEQAEMLLESKCDELQGYYFSKPVDEHSLPEAVKELQGRLKVLVNQ